MERSGELMPPMRIAATAIFLARYAERPSCNHAIAIDLTWKRLNKTLLKHHCVLVTLSDIYNSLNL